MILISRFIGFSGILFARLGVFAFGAPFFIQIVRLWLFRLGVFMLGFWSLLFPTPRCVGVVGPESMYMRCYSMYSDPSFYFRRGRWYFRAHVLVFLHRHTLLYSDCLTSAPLRGRPSFGVLGDAVSVSTCVGVVCPESMCAKCCSRRYDTDLVFIFSGPVGVSARMSRCSCF